MMIVTLNIKLELNETDFCHIFCNLRFYQQMVIYNHFSLHFHHPMKTAISIQLGGSFSICTSLFHIFISFQPHNASIIRKTDRKDTHIHTHRREWGKIQAKFIAVKRSGWQIFSVKNYIASIWVFSNYTVSVVEFPFS